MFHEIEKTAAPLTLEQRLVREVMTEAQNKIRVITDHRGLIAEAETLAKRLSSAAENIVASPVISPHKKSLNAFVLICFAKVSQVRSSLAAAGLHIYVEKLEPKATRDIWELTDRLTLTLVGFDVQIIVDSIADEVEFEQEAA